MLRKFIIKLQPMKYESLSSFAFRLALRNFYGSPMVIRDDVKVNYYQLSSNNISFEVAKVLAEQSDNSVIDLFNRSIHYLSNLVPEELSNLVFLKKTIKFCPLCVGRHGIHIWSWCYTFINVCIEHHLVLQDSCSSCGKKVKMPELIKNQCQQCNFILSRCTILSVPIDSEVESFQRYFLYKVANQNHLKITNKILDPLSTQGFIELLFSCLGILEGLKSNVPPYSYEIKTFGKSNRSYYDYFGLSMSCGNVYWMFQDFPSNFYKVLNAFYESAISNDKKKKRKRAFEKVISGGHFITIMEAYKRFHNTLTKKDIVTRSKITRNQMDTLIQKGVIEKGITKITQRRKFRITVEDYDSLIGLTNPNVSLICKNDVAEILGIDAIHVNRLIDLKVIMPYETPNFKICLFNKSDIEMILNKINVVYTDHFQDKISLDDCLKLYYKSKEGAGIAIKLIIENEVNVYSKSSAGNIGELFLKSEDLDKINIISTFEVSKILRCENSLINRLVENRILIPRYTRMVNNREKYFFTKKDVLDFKADYIGIPHAARIVNIPYTRLSKLVDRGELTNYFEGISRKKVIKLSEAKDLLGISNFKNWVSGRK